jgi:hypothetical protein
VAYRLFPVTAGAFAGLFCAYAVLAPSRRPLEALYLLIALFLVAALTPQFFIASTLLLLAVSTAWSSPVLSAGGAQLYLSDFTALMVAARGALPRARFPSNRALTGAPAMFFALWALVMAIAAVRGTNAGVSLVSAIRGDIALIYLPLLYVGFARVLRETDLRSSLLWRNLALVALGLAAWMFVARALNHPFHDPGSARVPTAPGEAVFRNFGFASAFIVYPALALVGIAGMAHGGGARRSWWILLASVGTIATLTTLVRGEIFGLALGALVILWLRPRSIHSGGRIRTAAQLGFAVVAITLCVIAMSPSLGNAIVQRALPFTHQSAEAEQNVEYRWQAVQGGFRTARAHPAGLGVLDTARLDAHHVDAGYLAHSGVATLLLFGGWPALVSALFVVLSLLRRSFRLATATPWLHPAFVAVLTMLTVYSTSAAGLVGDPWVMPLGALAVALRFRPSEGSVPAG